MQVTKSKHKLAWLKPILLTLAFIFMFGLALNVTPSIEAQAGYDFDEGDPTAKGSKELIGGPTWAHTGTVFYLVDEHGEYVPGAFNPVVYSTMYEGFVDRNGKPISDNNLRVSPRMYPGSIPGYYTGAIDKWGPPFTDSGDYRGIEIREWLLETADNGHKRAANLIQEHWGEVWAKKWENKELFLVFEGIAWNNVYCQGINTGVTLAATSQIWGGYQYYLETLGLTTPTGDPMVNKYTNNIYQHCMILTGAEETDKMGLRPAPSTGGLVTNDDIRHYMNGWGIGVVWNETPAINTYSPEEGSPGFPEDPIPDKVGASNIVKGYYTENLTTGVKTSDGTFTRKETTNLININDEPNYELVHWDISTSEPIEPNPTNWNPPAVVESGTTPTTVELEPEEKTLYVLLKRVEGDPPESNDDWVLEESEITKWVETGDKVKDDPITYTLPALNTCSGHEVSVKKYGDHSEACDPSCTSSHSYYDTETKYCDKFTLSDKTIKSVLININEDSATNSRNVLAKDGSYFKTRHTKDPSTDTRTSTSEGTLDTKGYNYEFIIHRLNKDKLTLLKYEPSPDSITPVKTLGTQYSIKEADVTSKTRYKGAEYIEKIKLILETDNGLSELKTTATGNISNHKKEAEATSNNAIEFDGDVTIKVYHLFS